MNKEETLTKLSELLKVNDFLKASGIYESNHSPHQFEVTKEHLKYASQHNGGVLSEYILSGFNCGVKGCRKSYPNHTSDMQLVLQLKRDATEEEVKAELLNIKEDIIKLGIDTVAFADTEEGYKFLK